jgi:alginate O-acetyltransferase complex protein AlgI
MEFWTLMENLGAYLFYNQEAPILFNSGQFLVFFILFLFVYLWIFNKVNWRIAWLAIFSFFFYYKSSGAYVLLLGGTAIFNYYMGFALKQTEEKLKRRIYLWLSILLNLSSLLYFKYTNFFLETLADLQGKAFEPLDIFLPIGISFFTFQTISYLVDVAKKEIEPCDNLLDFAFYLSFFPQLVAGPIVRAKDFIPQIRKELAFSKESIGIGLFMVLKGFIKKAIIADYIAQYVNLVYANPAGYSGIENLLGMYAYTLQIYCDFSGYSDMAIGLAAILGFQLPENFRSPYQSKDITEFWRRWHISLSSWLRDYVYIPLGGNRGGGLAAQLLTGFFMLLAVVITGYWWLFLIYIPLLTFMIIYGRRSDKNLLEIYMYINLMLTMLIGGWWHGADWKFVFWGFMHGLALIVHKLWRTYSHHKDYKAWQNFLFMMLTFHFVAFLWVYFRAESFETASVSIQKMFIDFNPSYFIAFMQARPLVLLFLLFGFAIHFISLNAKKRLEEYFAVLPIWLKAIIFIIFIQISLQFQDANVQPFIYFQF